MIAKAGHYELIAREGYPFIAPPALLALTCWCLGYPWASLVLLVLAVAVIFFFRNPERITPEAEGIIVSPADGTVMQVLEDVRSDNLPGLPLKRISIFMSVFNTHVNRCPVSGVVKNIKHVPGRYLDAREPASSLVNEHNSVVLQGNDDAIEVVQIAGKVARRIACWVRDGDQVRQGERFGLIRFGSRLDVYLPDSMRFVVSVGTTVRAGVTIIATRSAPASTGSDVPKS
jgi:phosphatidylserine decarboxylase